MILAGALAVIAWGALAFGAVYPWAFTPLLIGCAVVGAGGILLHRQRGLGRSTRAAVLAICAVLAAGLLQVVPLPSAVLRVVSPSTDAFLRDHDISYALAAPQGETPLAAVGPAADAAWHPLSLAPHSTLVGLAFLAAFTLFLVGLMRALSPSRARRLAALIVGFGVVLALVGIVQKATLGDHAWAGMKIYGFWTPRNLLSTPFGPFVNKNHFAGWMLMAIPLGLGVAMGAADLMRQVRGGWRSRLLWLSSPDGGRLQLSVLAVVLMVASLLMTKSRSGVGCLVAILVLTSVAAGRRFGSAKAGAAALVSLGVVFVLVFVLAGADFAARITNRMDAMELRKDIWADSVTVIRDFPVTGTGLNTFSTAMITYQSSKYDQHFQEAHNDYLQLLVEGGLLVALPVFFALGLVVRAIYRRFAAAQDDPMTWWVRAGATIGLLTIGLQAVVEFSLQMPGNAALFVVLLAIAMHETPVRRSPTPPPRPRLV